jgi:hypothetical protein
MLSLGWYRAISSLSSSTCEILDCSLYRAIAYGFQWWPTARELRRLRDPRLLLSRGPVQRRQDR